MRDASNVITFQRANVVTMFEPILTRNIGVADSEKIATYLARGGYEATRAALTQHTPAELIDMVKRSGLRGRGGAGFPAGTKWGFMPTDLTIPKIVAVNTDEGEPGTFKDRALVERDPHQVIEGVIIAAYAVGANRAYVYIRGEFFLGVKRWIKAIADAYERGFLGKDILGSGFDLDLSVHRGAGAYICGEETAMLESLEGKPGNPRLKPPYPAQRGLFGLPTLVHNVETLACIPHIVQRGPEWFASIGTSQSTGPKMFCVSGHVNRPGNYELPLGTPLREIIEGHAGGMVGGRKLKAVIPGGASTPVLTADQIDTPMAFETLAAAGSALGTGAIIVMDETTCMVEAARRLTRFFAHESCGRCVPCRVGSQRLYETLDRIERGKGHSGDIDLALRIAQEVDGTTFCPMGAALANPARSTIERFRSEYEYHVAHRECAMKTMDGGR
jgi:NADH-quinone oxidoreductase subunit F